MTDELRLRSPDMMKGFVIVAVVFVHLVIARIDSVTDEADAASLGSMSLDVSSAGPLLIQALYLGLMAFFIISGYFFRPGRGFAANIRKRAVQLAAATALCAVVLPLVTYCLMAAFGKAPGPGDILVAFQWGFGMNGVFQPIDVFTVHPVCGGCIGYYYIWSMLWGFVIFYAIADRIYGNWKLSLAAIAVLLVSTLLLRELLPIKLPMYFQLSPIAAAFMILGMMMAEQHLIERIEAFDILSGRHWCFFLGTLLSAAVLVFLFPPGLDFSEMQFGEYGGFSVLPYFAESALMFVFFTHLAALLSRFRVFNASFGRAGQNSLGILLLHGSLATMMGVPFYTFTNSSWFPDEMGLVPCIVAGFLSILASMVICRLGRVVLDRMASRGDTDSARWQTVPRPLFHIRIINKSDKIDSTPMRKLHATLLAATAISTFVIMFLVFAVPDDTGQLRTDLEVGDYYVFDYALTPSILDDVRYEIIKINEDESLTVEYTDSGVTSIRIMTPEQFLSPLHIDTDKAKSESGRAVIDTPYGKRTCYRYSMNMNWYWADENLVIYKSTVGGMLFELAETSLIIQ